MTENFAKDIRWDLSDLYSSIEDPKIQHDLDLAKSKAIDFEKKYKPLFSVLTDKDNFPLAQLLKDYKEIVAILTKGIKEFGPNIKIGIS